MQSHNQPKTEDSDDEASQTSVQINTNNNSKYVPVAKLGDKLKTKKIVINLSDTQYGIVEEVAEELGWLVQKEEGIGDWDVWWTDRQIQANVLFRMNLHQKINHFPGIYILARKNLFGLGLMSMQERYPNQYNFFPETWTIPLQFSQFRHYYESVEKGKTRTYIVKPEALSQGRGIFLTRNIDDILNGNKYVIQRYIKNPLLIDKLKFDLRIYVLLAGTDPLRLYIYQEGLARFATQEYQQPNPQNISRSYIHLTNYSLNKSNPNYIFNNSQKDTDKGHKRSLTSIYERLARNGVDIDYLKSSIEDAIIKSVISGLPSIRHQYRYCQPEQYEGGMCFHILGFDVMLTEQMKPIVIEINHTPSFETATPLDYSVKKNLIKDTLRLMRVTQKNKRKNFERAKELARIRLQTGKRQILRGKQRQQNILRARIERDALEKDIMGGYKRIFPPFDQELERKYNGFYETALKISTEDNQTRKKLLKSEKKTENSRDCPIKRQFLTLQKHVKRQQIELVKHISATEHFANQFAEQSGENLVQSCINADGFGQSSKNLIVQKAELRLETVDYSKTRSLHNELNRQEQNQRRINFRTKLNRRINLSIGSNKQLIKQSESINRFNQIMIQLLDNKNKRSCSLPQNTTNSTQQIKVNTTINQRQKISRNLYTPNTLEIDLFRNPPIKIPPQVRITNIRDLKSQIRNGSFLKPKNYMYAVNKKSFLLREGQSEEEGDSQFKQELTEYLIGGISIDNRTSNCCPKIIKPLRKKIGMQIFK